jgi:hypothetical protein
MGIDFRGAGYTRFVRLGKRTIKDGEAAAIWNMNGTHTQVVGPKLVRLWYSQIRFLDRYAATAQQFLKVEFVDGRIEHLPGPVSVYKNPVYHKTVEVQNLLTLKSKHEYAVVFSANIDTAGASEFHRAADKMDDDSKMPALYHTVNLGLPSILSSNSSASLHRNLIQGPQAYMPTPSDKIHEFKWSPVIKGDRAPEAFNVLKTQQDFSDVKFLVKTADNEEATIICSLSISIVDVSQFLDNCDDLHAAIFNALSSDLINVSSHLKWDELAKEMQLLFTSKDSKSLAAFPTLKDKINAIAVSVDAFSFRGMDVSAEFQAQYNNKIRSESSIKENAARSEVARKEEYAAHQTAMRITQEKLAMEQEAIKQEEAIADLKIEAARQRIEKEQELTKMQVDFENQLLISKDEARSKHDESKNAAAIEFLSSLKNLDVDLTSLLNTGGNANLVAKLINHAPAMESFMDTMERKGLWSKISDPAGFELVSK